MQGIESSRSIIVPGEHAARTAAALFGGLFMLSLALVAATPIPAACDYLNHLARMYLLAADRAGVLSPFYEVRWGLYPNLAMDLFVPWLSRWAGVETASRLFLLTAQLLLVSGAVAIELAVKKRSRRQGSSHCFLCGPFPSPGVSPISNSASVWRYGVSPAGWPCARNPGRSGSSCIVFLSLR